jgi:hypothetical protein
MAYHRPRIFANHAALFVNKVRHVDVIGEFDTKATQGGHQLKYTREFTAEFDTKATKGGHQLNYTRGIHGRV